MMFAVHRLPTMADYSLDEIIRSNRPQFAKTGVKQRLGLEKNARQGVVRPQIGTFGAKKSAVGIKARLQIGAPASTAGVQDARMKIMQKQNLKVKDARDKLNLLARKTDARQRLQKLQSGKVKQAVLSPYASRNLKATNANSFRAAAPMVITTVQPPVQKAPQKQITFSKQGLTVVQRQTNPIWTSQHRATAMETNSVPKKHFVTNPSGILITTKNETAMKRKLYQDLDEDEDLRPVYNSKKIKISTQSQPSSVSSNSSPNRLSANLQARLGGSSEGISPLQGYKIMVSNLHPIVTQEDIIELFGDIGPLRRALLLKQGTAEIVFVRPDDAKKAVETYHNRQLDGQPMACKLVTLLTTGGESIHASSMKSSNSGARMQQQTVESRVTPDISVIHKALFNKKPTASQKDIFTITMS